MNIKYRHRNCDKAFTPATFAYELPSAMELLDMVISSRQTLAMNFGMTLVHPRDQYNKAIGREKAEFDCTRIPQKQFDLNAVRISNGRTLFNFHGSDRLHRPVDLSISVDFQTQKVRMENIDVIDTNYPISQLFLPE